MMKKNILFGVALTVLAGCSQDVLVDNEKGGSSGLSDKIEFGLSMADNATKGSISGTAFRNGAVMAVYGWQTTDGVGNTLFNDQTVTYKKADGTWFYSPAKYWNRQSTYKFWAMYPQTEAHVFDWEAMLFEIGEVEVADDPADQVDVMIARQIPNHTPFNTVDLSFVHMLSNVNFFLKGVASEISAGVASVDVIDFDVTGLHSKGTYTQSGWSSTDGPEGMWMVDEDSEYDFPAIEDATDINCPVSTKQVKIVKDLLLMPQDIASEAMVYVKYRINYSDGTSSTFKKSVPFASIVGKSTTSGSRVLASWYPSYKYNYYLIVNPSKLNGAEATDETDADDTERPADKVVVVIPDTDGDLEDEYWIDEDGDGTPDYPLVWDDPDGDGKQQLYPDHDGDGIPDYRDPDPGKDPEGNDYKGDTDGDHLLDDLWIDTDGDGEADTEVERDAPVITPADSDIPVGIVTDPYIDYDGGVDGYGTPGAYLVGPDEDGIYWIDTDGDGNGDVKILWEDIDGDGKLEGIADKDGDGELTDADSYDEDGKDYTGADKGYDVILVDTNGDGVADTELERASASDPIDSSIPSDPSDYQYEAYADYDGGIDGYKKPAAWLGGDLDGDLWIDVDGDGVYDSSVDLKILWKDIDGDNKLEGIVDKDGDGILTDADTYDGDGLDYTGKTNYYDVVMIDKDFDGVAETELEREKAVVDPEIETDAQIEFSAEVEDWADAYKADIYVTQ